MSERVREEMEHHESCEWRHGRTCACYLSPSHPLHAHFNTAALAARPASDAGSAQDVAVLQLMQAVRYQREIGNEWMDNVNITNLERVLASARPASAEPNGPQMLAVIASEIGDAIAAHDAGEQVNALARAGHVVDAVRGLLPYSTPPAAAQDRLLEAGGDAALEGFIDWCDLEPNDAHASASALARQYVTLRQAARPAGATDGK